MDEEKSVCEVVREAEYNYVYGVQTLSKHVQKSMYETIERIDAYTNSVHTSGETDSLGRDKPFFNIVSAAENVWYRATDIDRKDIRILPSKESQTTEAFVATQLLQQWMRDARFGQFLNEWGRTLARYGSAVSKWVEKNGELVPVVVSWNRFIPDPIDFDAIPHIEKLYLTESQLQKKVKEGYDKEQVDALCDARNTRKTLDKVQQDNQSNFIELYEVHGEMSKATYNKAKGLPIEEGDDDIFFQQMHVVSFVQNDDGEYQDFALYVGREKQDPYIKTDLIPEDGQTLSIGAVEYLFTPQWMVNHSVKNMKDVLDLSSKLIFQTADQNFVGRNVLNAIESGDILIHKENMPLTQINNSKADVVALQNFSTQWQILGQQLTNTPDLTRGITQAQPVTYGLGQILNSNSNSLFEIMVENKGLAIEDMMRKFVLPFLMKRLDSKDEIVAILDESGITEIDELLLPRKSVKAFNQRTIEHILNPESFNTSYPSPYISQNEIALQKQELAKLGNKRFIKPEDLDAKTWKEALTDFPKKVVVEVTNEPSDEQTMLQNLVTTFQTVVSLAGQPMSDEARTVFNTILTKTGAISPLQLSTTNKPSPQAPPQLSPTNTPSPSPTVGQALTTNQP